MRAKTLLACVAVTCACALGYKKIKGYTQTSHNSTLGFNLHNVFNHNTNVLDFGKSVCREFKYAMQRAIRGYDETMFWNFNSYLDKLIITDLRWMLKNRHGSPVLEGWTQESCHEEFTKALKQMLYHFEQSTEELCSEKNEYEDLVDFDSYFIRTGRGTSTMVYKDKSKAAETMRENYFNRSREIDAYRKNHHEKALELLTTYYKHLWD